MIRTLFVDPRERATALGIWAAMAALGSALGPLVGGALLEAFSWHSAFLVNVPIMALAVGAGLMLLPEGKVPTLSTLDLRGTLLSIVGMAALLFAIKTAAKEGGTSVSIGFAVLAGAAVLLLGAQWLQLVEGYWPLHAGEAVLQGRRGLPGRRARGRLLAPRHIDITGARH